MEEPEAHIHTHIQKTLLDRLSYPDTQVIYSTHSTQISEVSNVENVNILGRSGSRCEAFRPSACFCPQSTLGRCFMGSAEDRLANRLGAAGPSSWPHPETRTG
ncbi:hypothetical protein [Rhizobium mongolense]|nr:hypothetical protein [Rhizobium mongolense]